MSTINLLLPSYMDSKECLVLATTHDGRFHASWQIKDIILCFEIIPEDSLQISCSIWTNELEYLSHIEKTSWIANFINNENTNLKENSYKFEGLVLPRFLRASFSFLENLKKKEE